MTYGLEMKLKRPSAVIGLVDDDESVRIAISSSLRSANWGVITYACANDLLADTRRPELKLVVADIQMPGMDGFALLESIKRWQRPIPIVFITAHTTQDLLERAQSSGAAGFFAKPLDDARLLALIGELLRK
jgi:FixJ family two-component response regulator